MLLYGVFFILLGQLIGSMQGSNSLILNFLVASFFVVATSLGSIGDETLLAVVEDAERNVLLLHVQHRIKGNRTIQLDIAKLAFSTWRVPSRGSPVYAVGFSDGNNKWELRSNFEGIGDDTYNEIVNELKARYAAAWPPPKKWRRVI